LPPGLRAVLQSETLVQTLERYLDLGCDATHAAADLGVHRATVYYRLARIEERGGFDLQDGATRLELHMALKLARLADVHGPR
jgi:DNA-binding PucR family transcriptional regulator